jgi:hypothetical protein
MSNMGNVLLVNDLSKIGLDIAAARKKRALAQARLAV